jgi:MFS family permease
MRAVTQDVNEDVDGRIGLPYLPPMATKIHDTVDAYQATAASPAVPRSTRYAWYVVGVLTVCYTLSFIDRQILSLLVGPIKKDLGLSDTQIGLLGGLAFSVFYTFLGLPIGRLVDRYNRRTIITLGVFFWSLMTAACAFARSYPTLFLARMGVGVGEAAMNPAAVSIIADTFPRERLASAMSFYTMGIYLGAGLALLVGGAVIQGVSHTPFIDVPLVGELASWRVTFLVVGLPGLLIALWAWTLREPPRRNAIVAHDGQHATLSIRETVRELSRRWVTLYGIAGGQMFLAVALYGFMLWSPVLLQRIHLWSPQQTGTRLGLVVLVAGCLGMFIGGRLTDRGLKAGVRDAALRLATWTSLGAFLMAGLAMTVQNSPLLLLALFFPIVAFLAAPIGSCYAALQTVLPNQVRGQAVALFIFVTNLGGLTLGPLLPGLLNDYVFHDEQAIGRSLLWTLVISLFAASLVFASARRTYRRDHTEMHP